jgi:hypothetical protein
MVVRQRLRRYSAAGNSSKCTVLLGHATVPVAQARSLDVTMDGCRGTGRRFSRKLKVWKILGEIKECYRLSTEASYRDRGTKATKSGLGVRPNG